MNEVKYVTVTALTKYIRYKFDHDIHLQHVRLEGEISNFKKHSRGHFYFTLKDQDAQISATMFVSSASRVNFVPKDGMTVRVHGTVTVYEPQGSYQINVVEMLQQGLGDLHLAYEALKKELLTLGYFDQVRKKTIPSFPKAIGVITSPTGAVIRDIVRTIERRYPLAAVYLYPANVQGEDAKDSIVRGIELANKQNKVDVLIVGRGGGSIEDLWCFNERVVADAIYRSKLPIISAVGHETDFTIADFVADMRAATPTAAAEIATPNILQLRETVRLYREQLDKLIKAKVEDKRLTLLYLDQRLESRSPEAALQSMYQKKMELDRLLQFYFRENLAYRGHKLAILIEKLAILNPLMLMQKGYSIVTKQEQIVRTAQMVNPGDRVKITFVDGARSALIVKEGEEA